VKILFVSSGSEKGLPSPIIQKQADSLKTKGIDVYFYVIKAKGGFGYIKEIFLLRKYLQKHSFDIIHAHYGLSAIVTTCSKTKPLVVSLMGSDVHEGGWQKFLIKRFVKSRWAQTIAKTKELAQQAGKKYCKVIPNGVDLDQFSHQSILESREKLDLDPNKIYVLFAANSNRPEKNFSLCKKAFIHLNLTNAEIICMENIKHKDVPVLMNASDVVCLSSLWEGSPNVIKEAMACNKPIVSTNVGDVEWLFGDEPGHFIANSIYTSFAKELKNCLEFSKIYKNTNGRNRIISLGLDSDSIATQIFEVYKTVINENTIK